MSVIHLLREKDLLLGSHRSSFKSTVISCFHWITQSGYIAVIALRLYFLYKLVDLLFRVPHISLQERDLSGNVLLLELYFVHFRDHTLVASNNKPPIQNAEILRRPRVVLVMHVQRALELAKKGKIRLKSPADR